MKIGLFFGSFNPVHKGHLGVAQYCLQHTDLQAIWMVMSPHNPHKKADDLMPQNLRWARLQAALQDIALPIEACDVELHLPTPSYTITTLQALSTAHPQHQFCIIMGADNLASIDKWKNSEQILQQYPIFVYPRVGFDAARLCEQYHAHFLDAPRIDISATQIREALKAGQDVSQWL
ncbi:putative nicotinate-nucleotide adenylyltransferase [Bacteroidia bacterium]|nr:putative nicotinate-nucleotide adenylyltransferase [Bacteroidia bacterium]